MMSNAVRWRAALWWLVPVAAFAVLLGIETDWGSALHRLPEPLPPIEPKAVAAALLPEYTIEGGLPGHAETVHRTLFNPTRRPAPTLAGDGGPRSLQRGQFVLTGTAVAGERHIAFLREVSGGKSRAVRQGEQINGLLVAEVKADRIRFTLGDESEELVLKVAPGPKASVPPPTAQAVPVVAPVGAPPAFPAAAAVPAAAPAAEAAARAQRRRAAAAAAGSTPPEVGAPVAPAPTPAPAATPGSPTSQTAPTPPPGMPANADPAWNEVFERMRQRPQQQAR